jgi:zinc/manganese transport system substrate-binding protein
MKKQFILKHIILEYISIIGILFFLGCTPLLQAKIDVITSYPYIADIVRQVGGNDVSVKALAKGARDPHFITPKPSFIAKLRKAELLVINGAQLEIGWLPPVIRQSNNAAIQPGKKGFLSLFNFVEPIDSQENVSRAHGDIHPEGNPHIQMNPHHFPIFAEAIADKLCSLLPSKCEVFKKNLADFISRWNLKMTQWDKKLAHLKGQKIITYHKLFDYFFKYYGIEIVGTLEPLPGIPPTPRHIGNAIKLIKREKVQFIIQDVYHSPKSAKYAAAKAGIKLVTIPHDLGAVKGTDDLISLFDEIVRRLTQ